MTGDKLHDLQEYPRESGSVRPFRQAH